MTVRIINADCRTALAELPSESVHCCVTSPPYYGLRDYGCDGQLGLEETPDAYVAEMVAVFREVRRVLRSDGTLWLNIGDSYAGSGKGGNPEEGKQATNRGSQSIGVLYGETGKTAREAAVTNVTRRTFDNIKAKDLIGIPWMLAFAMRADGWWLRQDIIWSKPNPMPESVTDRCTKAHEYLFMLSKSARYYYDAEAIKEPATWDLDGDGTTRRKERAREDQKSMPDAIKNGIRPLYKDAKAFNGKHSDKQRGHSRRHAGFNDRWDAMEKAEQCSGMRNKRSVWEVATRPFPDAHFATFPPDLIEPCILAGCPKGGMVIDPFGGAGTTALVADRLERSAVVIELNPAYATMARNRLEDDAGMFAQIAAD